MAVVLAGGCEWDGPRQGVRVVIAPTTESAAGSGGGRGAVGNAGESAGAPVVSMPPDDPPVPGGLEDRPGTFGVLDVPATVAVVGDSLTVAATDEINDALSRIGVRAVILDGRESRRMAVGSRGLPSGVAAIEGILGERRPDLWVVALGTNDVGAAVDADRFRTDLRETLAMIPPRDPVVWVDVWIRDRHDDVVEANTVLHGELSRRSAPTVVVDWYSVGSIDGVITADGVHLTEAGQDRFATEIADAVVTLAVAAD